jgi:hypothetical protein
LLAELPVSGIIDILNPPIPGTTFTIVITLRCAPDKYMSEYSRVLAFEPAKSRSFLKVRSFCGDDETGQKQYYVSG